MVTALTTALACAALGQPLAEPGQAVRYDGDKVVAVVVEDEKIRRAVIGLSEGLWECGEPLPGFPMRLQMSPQAMGALDDLGVTYIIEIDNVQALFDAENARLAGPAREEMVVRGELPGAFFDDFRTNAQMSQYMDALVAAYPDRVSRETIGQSVEGRDIYAIRITAGAGPKPVIFLDALQHAREWIAGTTASYIIDRLVRNPDADPRIEAMLRDFEVIIVPVVNPDGYSYTWTTLRTWRFNRRPPSAEWPCVGVDLNRNWGAFWEASICGNGHGPAPFSEPETQAVRDFAGTLPPMLAYVDLHSFGQLILSPYGHIAEPPVQAAALFDEFNNRLLQAVSRVNSRDWLGGPAARHTYPVSGGAPDWFFTQAPQALAWTWELTNTTTFSLPPSFILPTGREVFAGILELGDLCRENALHVEFVGQGRPARVSTHSPTPVRFVVLRGVRQPDVEASRMWWRLGRFGPFTSVPLSAGDAGALGPSLDGQLPAAPCGSVLQYYVEARTTEGLAFTSPVAGADGPYEAAASDPDTVLHFDMEAEQGWTADRWLNVDPNGSATQSEYAAQGSRCWVTGSSNPVGFPISTGDVDGATPLRLVSGPLDLAGHANLTVSYWRWFCANLGREPDLETFVVEASPDGLTWYPVETVGPGGPQSQRGWFEHSFHLDTIFTPTTQTLIRFSASDIGADTFVEAGVDDVKIFHELCPGACPGDWTRDGTVNSTDVSEFINTWFADQANGTLNADFDGNGISNSTDVSEFINAWFEPC